MAQGKRKVSTHDVEKLRELLSHTQAKILTHADPGYEASIERWSPAASKPAGVAVVPTTAEEVAIAVKYATEQDLDLAVKGGGHSTAGASSTDGGGLIDLGGMRNVRVDVENHILHVPGGCLWGDVDVDDAAWRHGLATVGGTVADTGVGGLTLGGGHGVLSGTRGRVTDNLLGATVVLASGEIRHVSAEENEELFWAIRGAGQNFGVTTTFEFKAYPQQEVYQGLIIFPAVPQVVTKVIDVLNDLFHIPAEGQHSKTNGKLSGVLILARPPEAGGATMLGFVAVYDGPEDEGRRLLQPLFDASPVHNTMAMGPYPAANRIAPIISGLRTSMKGAANTGAFMSSQPDAPSTLIGWEFYDPTTVVAYDNGCFANRGYHLNALVMPQWSKAESDGVCRQWARDMSLEFEAELERQAQPTGNGVEGGVSVRGEKGAVMLYGNYDQYDEISRDIFGENYPRRQNLKAKYDPKNMFNKLFPITPELAN